MPFYHRPRSYGSLPLANAAADAVTAAGTVGQNDVLAPGALQPGAYAVIDLETTGLNPFRDAIIEVALVLTDATGRPQRQWSTLVNPAPGQTLTRIGASAIHGLKPTDLSAAPALADIADLLAKDLSGRVLVAHNAHFDATFISRALVSSGNLLPGARIPRLCTMQWARHFLPTPSRGLTTCCAQAGVELPAHHHALADACGAAGLLRYYLQALQENDVAAPPWHYSLQAARRFDAWRWREAAAQAARSRLRERAAPAKSNPQS